MYDIPTCPQCEKVSFVPYDDSIKIADYLVLYLNKIFVNDIRKYKKIQILANVLWAREKVIRDFQDNYTTIDINKLLSCNLLLRRLIRIDGFLGIEEISEEKINQIIQIYGELAKFEEDRVKLESNHCNMVKLDKYDLQNLNIESISRSITVCPNENYARIMRTFEKYNIVSENMAKRKMNEWGKDWKPVERGTNKSYSSEETIKRFYDLISGFFLAFNRNRVMMEGFGLKNVEEIDIDPMKIKIFVASYPTKPDGPSFRQFSDFQGELIGSFGGRFKQFMKHFVLSEDNPDAFPLFVKLGDVVLMSQNYGEFYTYMLHAILNKDLFHKETEKRSKEIESRILKSKFEELGYRYIPNHKVKNKLEIDGIAISNSQVYVIELKSWAVRKLLEEKMSEENLKRDIRGAIDGIKTSHTRNKEKKTVSLPRKVQWVRDHRKELKISEDAKITGVLIINEQTPIENYNDCLVRFIDDLRTSKAL